MWKMISLQILLVYLIVSIPTQAILQENLEIVTAPITSKDREVYESLANVFGNKNNHWEGAEVEKYKKESLQSKNKQ